MYINATGFYIPEARVDNQHFLELPNQRMDRTTYRNPYPFNR